MEVERSISSATLEAKPFLPSTSSPNIGGLICIVNLSLHPFAVHPKHFDYWEEFILLGNLKEYSWFFHMIRRNVHYLVIRERSVFKNVTWEFDICVYLITSPAPNHVIMSYSVRIERTSSNCYFDNIFKPHLTVIVSKLISNIIKK